MDHTCKDLCESIVYIHKSSKSVRGYKGDDGEGSIIPFSQELNATFNNIGFTNSNDGNQPFVVPRDGIITNLTAGLNVLSSFSTTTITIRFYHFLTSDIIMSLTGEYSSPGIYDLGINRSMVRVKEGDMYFVSAVPSQDNVIFMGSFTFL